MKEALTEYFHEDNDKRHGRIEQSMAYVTDKIHWLQELHQWSGLKSIGGW